MATKTPIQILQEILVKHGEIPKYSETGLKNFKGEFECIVLVRGMTYSGKGASKKDAKQNAASEAICGLKTQNINCCIDLELPSQKTVPKQNNNILQIANMNQSFEGFNLNNSLAHVPQETKDEIAQFHENVEKLIAEADVVNKLLNTKTLASPGNLSSQLSMLEGIIKCINKKLKK